MSECDICFNRYSSSRKPIVLPCGHTTCEVCLHSRVKGKILQCFFCQKEFPANFSLFPVNYSMMQESPQPNKREFNEQKNNLQSDISNLRQLEDQLTSISEDYETFNTICENEINSCVDSIIQSIENTKNQLIQKVRNIKAVNANKVNQHKTDIQTSIQVRKKFLKAIIESQNHGKNLDSSIYVELEVLNNVKDIEIKLQKAEFDHLVTILGSNVAEALNKNLNVKVENINFSQLKSLEKKQTVLTNQEDFSSINESERGNRRRGRGRGRGRIRGFRRGREQHINHGMEEEPGPGDLLNREFHENYHQNQHPVYEIHLGQEVHVNHYQNEEFKIDDDSDSHNSQQFHGRHRRAINNWGRRRPRGSRGRDASAPKYENLPRDECKSPINIQNDPHVNTNLNERRPDYEEEEWYIQLGNDWKILPNFVTKQINQTYRNNPIVRIINKGKLVNIANTTLMKYFQIGDDGEAHRSHPLMKRNKY